MTRPTALFISPVIPHETGNGLAMRAGTILRAMSRYADVSLLVVPIYGVSDLDVMPESLVDCCASIELFDPIDAIVPESPLPALNEVEFDVVHVFRLSVLDHARPYLASSDASQRRQLDLDDLESVTHLRLARLARSNRDTALAEHFQCLAHHYFELEREALATFERVLVCAEQDRALLHARPESRATIDILPNTIEIPQFVTPLPESEPFRFLFVGTLGYYPNEDGISWFAREVLPILNERAGREFCVENVGTGVSERVERLADSTRITLIGEVPDVAPYYQRASAVIVPVRAGGGTRIKVLEAFAFGRPVVSTPVGVEGIDVIDGQHVLIATDAESFADRCLRLMHDSSLTSRLAGNSRSFVSSAHAPSRAVDAIGSFFAAPDR